MSNTEKNMKHKKLADLLDMLEIPYKDIALALELSMKDFIEKMEGSGQFTLRDVSIIRDFIISKISVGNLIDDGDKL